ncbi:helix-turn-helix domain-containing protein [Pseudonocardia sp. NPDC049154]|uniref:helix-turn-helix domain-containing protein n=1 Tax=Pseudonocardia sp. NPDC049154 TaxID=3155501 RepID=UPI0033E66A94
MATPVPAVDRAARALALLAERPEEACSVTELAARIGIHKGTCHAILMALTDAGLVNRDPATRRFSLGTATVVLGTAAAERYPCTRVAVHEMHLLHARTGITVLLVSSESQEMVVEAVVGEAAGVDVGRPLPVVPPMGLVFRMLAESDEREAWLHRIDSPAVASYTRRALAAAREQGYAMGLARPPHGQLGDHLDRIGACPDPGERERLAVRLAELMRVGYYPTTGVDVSGRAQFLTAPVHCPHRTRGPRGVRCPLAMTLFDLPRDVPAVEVRHWGRELVAAVRRSDRATVPVPTEHPGGVA